MNLLIVLLGLAGIFAAFLTGILVIIGASKSKRYEQDYAFLSSCVRYFVVNDHNYFKIRVEFEKLRRYNINHQRTDDLWAVFKERYAEFFNREI